MITILEIINEAFDGILGTIPCYNTIENWVKKSGLAISSNAYDSVKGSNYSLIVDESITVGDQKLLLQLGTSPTHPNHSLKHNDVQVLGLSVSNSWTGENVQKEIHSTTNGIGYSPEYIVSDSGNNLCKAFRNSNIPHHRDISHSLGSYLERVYKDDAEFIEYVKKMGQCRKYSQTDLSYLMPPNQRSISRFMNMFGWVEWSEKMMNVFHTLSKKEQYAYSFIPEYASFISELSEVMNCYKFLEHICKQHGLSNHTVLICLKQITNTLFCGNERMIKLGIYIKDYFAKEASLLNSENEVHNNSSDIIESIFGVFKIRKSPNKLYGITPFVLFIPAYTKLIDPKKAESVDFKEFMEQIKINDIKEWCKRKLRPNLVIRRINKLGCTG